MSTLTPRIASVARGPRASHLAMLALLASLTCSMPFAGCASRCGTSIAVQPRIGPATPRVPAALARASVQLFPGVYINRAARVVEFDAAVVADVSFAETPRVYLETLVCTPMTREHEALLITSVQAAHIHAALLTIGLEPGAPGRVEWDGQTVRTTPPTGPIVDVRFIVPAGVSESGEPRVYEPADWIISTRPPVPGQPPERPARQQPPRDSATASGAIPAPGSFVFAGSRTRTVTAPGPDGTPTRMQIYAAQAEGTVVGFATFSSELLALIDGFSPDASVRAPEWIADATHLPPAGTPVRVRLQAALLGTAPGPAIPPSPDTARDQER